MAKDQRNVEAITPMEEDFAKWYTDICLKAELVDYSSVKGFTILRPYGYAIWRTSRSSWTLSSSARTTSTSRCPS